MQILTQFSYYNVGDSVSIWKPTKQILPTMHLNAKKVSFSKLLQKKEHSRGTVEYLSKRELDNVYCKIWDFLKDFGGRPRKQLDVV